MTSWFIQQNGEVEDSGPFRPSELLEMVRNGEVTADTILRKDDSAWFAASDVGGLFEAAMRPTIHHLCPQCETEIPEPPVICQKCGREVREGITRITENSIIDRSEQSFTEQAGSSVKRWLRKKRVSKENDQNN